MPFHYFLTIPKLDIAVSDQSDSVQIVSWLVPEKGAAEPGTPVVQIATRWAVLELRATGRGIIGRHIFEPGTAVNTGDPIAVIYADGEDLPYNRPVAEAHVVETLRDKPVKATREVRPSN